MVTLKIYPLPTSELNREIIRQIIHLYKGKASFSEGGMIHIQPQADFNLERLLLTLNKSGYRVEKI